MADSGVQVWCEETGREGRGRGFKVAVKGKVGRGIKNGHRSGRDNNGRKCREKQCNDDGKDRRKAIQEKRCHDDNKGERDQGSRKARGVRVNWKGGAG